MYPELAASAVSAILPARSLGKTSPGSIVNDDLIGRRQAATVMAAGRAVGRGADIALVEIGAFYRVSEVNQDFSLSRSKAITVGIR